MTKVFILSPSLCYSFPTPLGISVMRLLMRSPFMKDQLFRFSSVLAQNFNTFIAWNHFLEQVHQLSLMIAFLPCCCLACLFIQQWKNIFIHTMKDICRPLFLQVCYSQRGYFPVNEAGKLSAEVRVNRQTG